MEQLDLFSNVSVSVEYITPKIAESYLACSRGNRNISQLAEKVDLFLEKLNSGANLDRDDPIMALRTAIINWRSHFRFRSSQSDTVFRLACIFKAFNYWISGRKCRLIKIISGEAFPVIK